MHEAWKVACASPDGPLCVFDTEKKTVTAVDAFPEPATALGTDAGVWVAASLDWSIYVGWDTADSGPPE